MNKRYLTEIIVTLVCFFWLLFVATNVNVTLGQTYLHFTLGIFVLLIIDILIFNKSVVITFAKEKGRWFKAMMWGVAGYAILLVCSTFVMKFVSPANAYVGSIMRLLGASTPALAQSRIMNLLTFGFFIAYVETQLWARAMEFFADLFHIKLTKENIRKFGLLFLIALFSLAFLIFHLTAKSVTDLAALWVVFIMMFISLIMIVIFGETRQAVFLHITANLVGSYLLLFTVNLTTQVILPLVTILT